MKIRILSALAAAAVTAGCGTFGRIGYTEDLSASTVLMVDSDQRAIVSGERGKEHRVICAEPSPDTMSASALAAAANLEREDLGRLQASLAMTESSASIGLRTQTIQLLRDGMYRLCESYQNGAIDERAFQRMLRQYQQMVVGLVAIEQLTGTVHAPAVALEAANARANAFLSQREFGERLYVSWRSEYDGLNRQIDALPADDARRAPLIERRTALNTDIEALRDRLVQTITAETSAEVADASSTGQGTVQIQSRPAPPLEGRDGAQRPALYTPDTAGVVAQHVREITGLLVNLGNTSDACANIVDPVEQKNCLLPASSSARTQQSAPPSSAAPAIPAPPKPAPTPNPTTP